MFPISSSTLRSGIAIGLVSGLLVSLASWGQEEAALTGSEPVIDATAEQAVRIGRADEQKVGTLPPEADALTREGAQAFANGEWAAARTAYQKVLELAPTNALVHVNLGTLEHRSGNYDAAIKHLTKATALNPKLAQAWTLLGLIYYEEEEINLAISSFTRSLHEDPLDARTHNYLGVVIKGIGWTTGAEDSLNRAIELDPNYASAYFNLALMYLERKPPARELARRNYQRALSLGAAPDEIMEERLTDGE